jgi:hypothetical protein
MAEQDTKLPNVDDKPSESQNLFTGSNESSIPFATRKETSSKEMMIALGGIIVAAIIFLFIKNYFSKMMVASFKKSPRSAEMAGWSLFCILLLATIGAVLGILNASKFMSLPYLIPICLAMLASIISFIIALSSKR